MCGIVGIIRPESPAVSKTISDIFQQMWWGTQLRGVQGSGLFQSPCTEHGILNVEKSSNTPDYAIYEKEIAKLVNNVDIAPFTFAHCRAATKLPTKVDDRWLKKNAHPFQYKHITLMHNGFFTYVGKDHDAAHEVDSASFTYAVADKGIEAALKEAYGSYAIIFYNSQEKTLNIIRNKDRPLWKIEHKIGQIFISEPELALWVLARNSLEKPHKIEEVPPETLITFPYGKVIPQERKINTQTMGYKTPTSYPTYYDNGRNYFTVGSLSLARAKEVAGRFIWDDGVAICRSRRELQSGKLARDYLNSIKSIQKEEDPIDIDKTSGGLINRIYNIDEGFNIEVGKDLIFSLAEIHSHKNFCSIIGKLAHRIAKDKVMIAGNFNRKAKEIVESSFMLKAQVLSIVESKKQEKFIVNVGNIEFSSITDVTKLVTKASAPRQTLLLINRDDKDETTSLADLVTCRGCNTIVPTEVIKPVSGNLFVDDKNRPTTTVILHVCPECKERAELNFIKFYKDKYIPNANA